MTTADFSRVPDYSVVDPRRNWYQIVVAGSDRPIYAEESPTNVIRRFQSESGLRADGVIGDATLAALETAVRTARTAMPGPSADIYLASIRDDRRRRAISEGTWKAMIWASRDDLRQSPQALFDGAIRLDAFRSSDAIRLPPYGSDVPVALGAFPTQEKAQEAISAPSRQPDMRTVPPEAGSQPLPGGTARDIVVQQGSALSVAWTRAKPYLPAVAAVAAGIGGLALLWALMRKEEREAPSFEDYRRSFR